MSSSTLGSAETDEVDPIRASYDIFIKPQMSAKRQIYVLQFPNSTKHYSKSTECEPLAMRVKAAAGMVELDVPMDIYRNYDREKAVRWGEAMRKADGKSGASHGLPGGFGLGGNAGKGRPKAEERDQDIITLAEHYESSVRDGRVLMKQTLGGQVVPKGATVPQYMVGAFRKGALHLTPVDHIVQLRPQFHHLDALAEQEKSARARESGATTRVQEARAVHLTVKQSVDGEDNASENMADRLAAAQAENWRKHRYIDEDTPEAWLAYEDHLFVGPTPEPGQSYRDLATQLRSSLNDVEYIDTLSAPKDAAKLSRSKKSRANRAMGQDGHSDSEGGGPASS